MSKNNKRYFSDLSEEKYTVGKLSPKLRQALNLENDMLPFWIYRMRILGYPPAWMQAAESKTLEVIEGLSPTGTITSESLNLEDGELEDKLKYNKNSLIEFPGFNAPVPKNVKDDWLILGMPPYQQNQQLSVAAKSMKFIEPVPYKRIRSDLNSNDQNSSSDTNDFSIQNQQKEKTPDEDHEDEEFDQDKLPEENDKNRKPNSETTFRNQDLNISSNECFNNESNNLSGDKKIKVVSYGTPVPNTSRPSLPSLEKWSVGMGELLHFENLPNSTGAYKEKIKGLLERIRNRFTKN